MRVSLDASPNASVVSDQENEDGETVNKQHEPNLQTKGKFALFCSVVLNAQHRNVRQGINVYSSWASEANCAAVSYEKVGEKNREGYINIRTLATIKGFIEWGRRKLSAPGKPVIKTRDREDRSDDLSLESYVRLTYSGLSALNPDVASKESEWKVVAPPKSENSRATTLTATSKMCSGKLFVGGLAWETTADSLRSYFLQYGPIEYISVKEGRGFGLVLFRHPNDAEAALKNAGNHMVDHILVEYVSLI